MTRSHFFSGGANQKIRKRRDEDMTTFKLSALLLTASLTLPATVASAEEPAAGRTCGAHEAVVTRLAKRYQESRQAIALAGENQVIEIFASETGSWTILVTAPGGRTCLVAAGQAFEKVAEELPNTDPRT